VLKAMPSITRRVKTYGLAVQSDFVARDVRLTRQGGTARLDYELVERRQPLGRIALSVSGRHNVLNSLAAAAVGRELEIPFEKIQAGLASFTGVARRLELKGIGRDIRVIDDYGHHPTEVLAVLSTLKEAYAGRVLVSSSRTATPAPAISTRRSAGRSMMPTASSPAGVRGGRGADPRRRFRIDRQRPPAAPGTRRWSWWRA
jgi:UDP-N-acetylmuramate-alanine ligase